MPQSYITNPPKWCDNVAEVYPVYARYDLIVRKPESDSLEEAI